MNRELAAMITLAHRLVASGIHGTLSTLFAARGSTYRTLGAMMVSLPGTHAGGISGGCLEEHVARAGARATQDVPAVMLRFSTHPDSDDDAPILGCGGSIDVLVERGWTRQQAYAICSVAVDLKLSELVDVPNIVVSAFLPLDIFG